jgi:hypothetical protein
MFVEYAEIFVSKNNPSTIPKTIHRIPPFTPRFKCPRRNDTVVMLGVKVDLPLRYYPHKPSFSAQFIGFIRDVATDMLYAPVVLAHLFLSSTTSMYKGMPSSADSACRHPIDWSSKSHSAGETRWAF